MKSTRRQCLWALSGSIAAAASRNLLEEWQRIAGETDGTVGATALHLASGQMVSLHGSERFPLASVCKVPIAMNILALVDEGKLALDREIEVLPRDVFSGVSEIAKRWPAQRRFLLGEMIELMAARSDNRRSKRCSGSEAKAPRSRPACANGWLKGFAWIEASANAALIATASSTIRRPPSGAMKWLMR